MISRSLSAARDMPPARCDAVRRCECLTATKGGRGQHQGHTLLLCHYRVALDPVLANTLLYLHNLNNGTCTYIFLLPYAKFTYNTIRKYCTNELVNFNIHNYEITVILSKENKVLAYLNLKHIFPLTVCRCLADRGSQRIKKRLIRTLVRIMSALEYHAMQQAENVAFDYFFPFVV